VRSVSREEVWASAGVQGAWVAGGCRSLVVDRRVWVHLSPVRRGARVARACEGRAQAVAAVVMARGHLSEEAVQARDAALLRRELRPEALHCGGRVGGWVRWLVGSLMGGFVGGWICWWRLVAPQIGMRRTFVIGVSMNPGLRLTTWASRASGGFQKKEKRFVHAWKMRAVFVCCVLEP